MPQVSGRGIVTAAISAGIVLATSAGLGSAAAAAQQAPAAASQRVAHIIMVLRNQNGNMPRAAHASADRSSQASLLAHARSVGARNLHGFGLINAVAATVTPAQEAKLAADPSVARIFPDLPVSAGPSVQKQISTAAKGKVSAAADDQQICPSDPSKPPARARGAAAHAHRVQRPVHPAGAEHCDRRGREGRLHRGRP